MKYLTYDLKKRIINVAKTDQPGRIIAVLYVSPVLAYKGYIYDDTFIKMFALVLFLWDLWWLIVEPPRTFKILLHLTTSS
jgi:hypothetical protein